MEKKLKSDLQDVDTLAKVLSISQIKGQRLRTMTNEIIVLFFTGLDNVDITG